MEKIMLITGAPAAGKSTIAQAVAQRMEKSIHLRVDQLREMVVTGIALPTGGGWTEEATEQFRLARHSAIHMAQTYTAAGFTVIIDDVCVPEHFAADYAALPNTATVQRILLLPTQATILKRMDERNGPFDQFMAPFVPWIYACIDAIPQAGWTVLDSSDWTVAETLERVLDNHH